MAHRKRAVSLPEDVDAEVEAAAALAAKSVSRWITDAVRSRLRNEAGLAAVREWEAEHGELTNEEMSAARRRIAALQAGARPTAGSSSEDLMAVLERSLAAARAELGDRSGSGEGTAGHGAVVDLMAALEASLVAAKQSKTRQSEAGTGTKAARSRRRTAS
jgi:hypothetical protein